MDIDIAYYALRTKLELSPKFRIAGMDVWIFAIRNWIPHIVFLYII
jgi:hypothetical protein